MRDCADQNLRLLPLGAATSILALAFTVTVSAGAQGRTWTNYTDVNGVMDLAVSDDTLWMATRGGLVWMSTSGNPAQRRMTNSDGMGENDLRFVSVDALGRVWCGGTRGRLSRRRADAQWSVYGFVDPDDRPIAIYSADDDAYGYLWVGSQVGIHKFDIERHGGEIQESYLRIGGWPDNSPVDDVFIDDTVLWIAGDVGLARAGVNDPFLLIRSHWQTWSPGGAFHTVITFRGDAYAGGEHGVFRYNVAADSWEQVAFPDMQIVDLVVDNDTLWVMLESGLGYCTPTVCGLAIIPGALPGFFSAIAADGNGLLWAGQTGYGVWGRNAAGWKQELFDGPLGNSVSDVAIDSDGRAWCIFPNFGAAYLQDGHWTTLPYYHVGASFPGEVVEIAPNGDVWLGAFGTGAYKVNSRVPLSDTGWIHYDTLNRDEHTLMWFQADNQQPNNFILVTDIVIDDGGRVWLANTFADSGRAIAFAESDCWGYFGAADGIQIPELRASLALDENALYIGTRGNGLIRMSHPSSLCNDGDPLPVNVQVSYFTMQHGLPSDAVYAVLVDRLDSLWVGTTLGLAKWRPRLQRFVHIPLPGDAGLTITALAADVANGIWVGTSLGVVYLAADATEQFFTSTNSGIAGEGVRRITVDEATGNVWFATQGGLSSTDGPPPVAESVRQVIAYPNPVEITGADPAIVRFNADPNGRVMVYTIDGREVHNGPVNAGWDCRTTDGSDVASGIYLFVISGPDGSHGRGKIAVINRR
jgi:ligand-binding sensor domain-containing protein